MEGNTQRRSPVAQFLLLILVVGLFLVLGKFFHFDQMACRTFFQQFPLGLSGVVFIVAYVVVTFFIWIGPKDIFRIVAALIYGPFWSTVFVYVAEMINVVVLFSLSRRLGREFVASKIKGGMQKLDNALAETSFWSIFFLRLFPIVPFRFLDLGMGLTKISLAKYFLIALIATPLRIFVVQFFLALGVSTIMDANKFAAYLTQHPYVSVGVYVYMFGAVIMVFIMKRVSRKRRSSC